MLRNLLSCRDPKHQSFWLEKEQSFNVTELLLWKYSFVLSLLLEKEQSFNVTEQTCLLDPYDCFFCWKKNKALMLRNFPCKQYIHVKNELEKEQSFNVTERSMLLQSEYSANGWKKNKALMLRNRFTVVQTYLSPLPLLEKEQNFNNTFLIFLKKPHYTINICCALRPFFSRRYLSYEVLCPFVKVVWYKL